MRQFTAFAAAAVLAAMLSSGPAKADYNFGPVQNAGQCWIANGGGGRDFGYWGACPKPANAPVARTARPRKKAKQ